MTRKVYMIVPDITPPFNLGLFHNYIAQLHTSGYIYGWWHQLPGNVYLVDTALDSNQLYNLIIRHMPMRKFIVMEVNPKNQQGWLSKEAWDWFSAHKA